MQWHPFACEPSARCVTYKCARVYAVILWNSRNRQIRYNNYWIQLIKCYFVLILYILQFKKTTFSLTWLEFCNVGRIWSLFCKKMWLQNGWEEHFLLIYRKEKNDNRMGEYWKQKSDGICPITGTFYGITVDKLPLQE